MAHNINSMAYHGATPWHGLGTSVDHVMTSAEAIELAGLDWKVIKQPIFTEVDGKYIPVPEKFSTVRMDSKTPLGVVGKIYTVLQNKEAFSFFDAVVGVKEAMYHTAGALGNGERIWLLAKLPGYIRTKGDDITEKFLLLANSHDGSGSVQVMFTPIRVVCQNTLNLAVESNTNRVSIRHTVNMGAKIDDIREDLGIVNQKFQLLEEMSEVLASRSFKLSQMSDYLKTARVVPNEPESSGRAKNIIEEISRLFETGKGADLPSAKGTLWGAFNSVVEFVDYGRNKDSETRTDSILFGSGAQVKQRAFDAAMVLAKGR